MQQEQRPVQTDSDEGLVRRQVEEEEEVQMKSEYSRVQRQVAEEEEEEVQMQPEEEEEWLQMKVEALVAQRQITKGNTSIYTTPVLQKQQVIEFPPEIITVSAREKERILKKAGWKQKNVIMTLKDFRGEPLRGHMVYAQFKAPGVAAVTEGGEVKGGSMIWSNVWLKPEGTVRLLAVRLGTPAVVPEGIVFYKLSARSPLKLEAVQGSKEMTVTAATSEEAATKVGAKGTAGVDFKVFSVGGEVSTEKEKKRGVSLSKTWKVILPTATFKINQIK